MMKDSLLDVYRRFGVIFEHGSGVFLFDAMGNKYLDFVSGIAVNSLGYGHQGLNECIKSQLDKLIHCSNLFYNKPMIDYSKNLVTLSGLDFVFFCNSGTEANEAAFKLVRRYGKEVKGSKKPEIITMENSFHGRTFASMSLTGQRKYQDPFTPIIEGIRHVPMNDFERLERIVNKNTVAIFIEPIQGEGGLVAADFSYIEAVKNLCEKHNVILVFDEVQCGVGRTGTFFAYERFDIVPNIVTLAKGMAGGLPMGAMIVDKKYSEYLTVGNHGSTFGGNPLVCAAAGYVLNEVNESHFLSDVLLKGRFLNEKLKELNAKHDFIEEVRGFGLMQGLKFKFRVKDIVDRCFDEKLLIISAGEKVIRIIPPLIISKEQIEEGIAKLDRVLLNL